MAVAEQLRAPTMAPPRITRLAVATIFFVNGAVLANWFARIPEMKARLGLSEGAFGFALLSLAVGAIVAQPIVGWWIGKVGSRVATSAMALAFCVIIAALGFASSLPMLMLLLCLIGASSGGLDVAMNSQASLVEQQYGRSIMNSFHALWSFGGLIGASVAGFAASQLVPLETHFVIVAIVALAIIIVALRFLVQDSGAPGHEVGFALPPRALIPMGIVAFCALVCEGAVGDWSAIYLREDLGSSQGLAATGYAVFALLMAGGRFTGDWLTTRFGSAQLVRGGGLLMVVGIILALISNAPWLAIAGFALVGAGVSCIFPLIMSAAGRTPGIAPGTAIAAMATIGYSGFLVGPPLIGSVAELVDLRASLGLLTIMALLIVALGASVRGGRDSASTAARHE